MTTYILAATPWFCAYMIQESRIRQLKHWLAMERKWRERDRARYERMLRRLL